MTEYVLSCDPGLSNGIALIRYEPETRPELWGGWQFGGGARALHAWIGDRYRPDGWDDYHDEPAYACFSFSGYRGEESAFFYSGDYVPEWSPSPARGVVISEKFTARNTRGFSYTTASLEPLRGEGVLLAHDLMPDYTPTEKRWRDPGLQYLVGGTDKADKKKRQHAFLKDNGFYRTGKDLGAPDGDDFRSAAAHGLAYLARELKHRPTYDMIKEWTQ